MSKQTINIAYTVDDKYVDIMGVSIYSLKKNRSKNFIYDIYVLYKDGTISEENKKRVLSLSEKDFNIHFVDVSKYLKMLEGKLKTRDYYSITTYYRLFIPLIFPDINKMLYLDSDTLILGDVSQLYNTELGENYLAGATDEAILAIPIFQKYVEEVVGVDKYQDYFNAGVILMNIKKFREDKLFDKFVDLNDKYYFIVAQDQDLLNVLCRNKVHYFDHSWNKNPTEITKPSSLNLIHYHLTMKPWHYDGIMYSDDFWSYANETDFYDNILKEKQNFSEEDKKKDEATTPLLFEKAQKEIDNINNYKRKFLIK
ncbi:MAG TPA: hypothetical protein DDW16_00210 [Clostridiales bacterium]|nr:hypothetical protein [Clostridiales bacterium]